MNLQIRKFTIPVVHYLMPTKRINSRLRMKTHNPRVYFYGLFSKDDS